MEKLIIIVTHKKKLGNVLIPYIASTENSPAITLFEQAVPDLFKNGEYSFTDKEKEIIDTLYSINEKTIYKLFSKDKTLKLFYDKLKQDFVASHIRPYIEKNIYTALKLLSEQDIPFYYKDPKYSKIYETDLIKFHRTPADALFQFNLADEELTYTLKIFSENKKIELKNRDIIEITNEPASMLINNHLYRFENINVKKFRPFREKDHISIPKRSIDTYMSSFVRNSILNHKVETEGFSVVDEKVSPMAFLSVDTDLQQKYVLTLKFQYKDRLFLASTRSNIFVRADKKGDQYIFTRMQRDNEWENSVRSFLTKQLHLRELNNSQYIPASETEQDNNDTPYPIISWINAHSDKLKKKNIEILQKKSEAEYFTGVFNLKFDITEKEDWFDINAFVEAGGFSIPFYKFRKNLISNIREYKLPDDKIFVIPAEWFTKYSEILFHADIKDEKIKLRKVFFNLLNFERSIEEQLSLNEKLRSLFNEPQTKVDIPKGINATLRPYQTEGYSWLYSLKKNRFGGILADDMGLGKTIQAITLLLKVYEKNKEPQKEQNTDQPLQLNLFSNTARFNKSGTPASIVVMPTSLIHNWFNELKRFAPQIKTYIYTGSNRLKTKDIGKILRHYHVILTTYGIVRNDIDYLSTYKFHYVILDESQYVKNPSSKTYSAVIKLLSDHRLVLTGTPIENSLSDLWAQMNFVNQGLLGNFNRFKTSFIKPIIKGKNEETEKKLRLLIDPFILRRTKEMVAKDLPPMTEQVILCDMTREQKDVYVREKSGVRNELLNTFKQTDKNSFIVLQALTRLRQIANHPVLVNKDYRGSSGKFEQIMSGLEDIVSEKHKVLVFSSFVKNLEIIEKELQEKGLDYSKLTGSTTNREEVIKKFTNNEDCRIFLISLKAGGVGLNLVKADYVFMLNPWWNPAAEAQAINRAHRIGQTKKVFVYKFLSAETIEEKIANLQKKKQELADTFINTENLLKNLTKEEFEKLLS